MKLKALLVAILLLPAYFTSFSMAAETKKTASVDRRMIQQSDVAGTDEELVLMLVTFPPGAESPPHLHPVVGLNYVIEGSVDSQYEGKPLEHFKAGDSYKDLAGPKHLIFRNPSTTLALKFLIAYKIKKGVPFKKDIE